MSSRNSKISSNYQLRYRDESSNDDRKFDENTKFSRKYDQHDDRLSRRDSENRFSRSEDTIQRLLRNNERISKSTQRKDEPNFGDRTNRNPQKFERRQERSKFDDELQESIENKIKFQESFGIDRKSSEKSRYTKSKDHENRRNSEDRGKIITNIENVSKGGVKDLRELLNSKRRQNIGENSREVRVTDRFGHKNQNEEDKEHVNLQIRVKNTKDDLKSSRLVTKNVKILESSQESITKSQQSPSKSSEPDTQAKPTRVRKPVRVRNPLGRLADLVRFQVVDAVERNSKREDSTSSTSKAASHESLIEISSSSDDAKVEDAKNEKEKGSFKLELAMDRLKGNFEDVSSSESENWLDMMEEEEKELEKELKNEPRHKEIRNKKEQIKAKAKNVEPHPIQKEQPKEPKSEPSQISAHLPPNKLESHPIEVIVSNRPDSQEELQITSNQADFIAQKALEPSVSSFRPQIPKEEILKRHNSFQSKLGSSFRSNKVDSVPQKPLHYNAFTNLQPSQADMVKFSQFGGFGSTSSFNMYNCPTPMEFAAPNQTYMASYNQASMYQNLNQFQPASFDQNPFKHPQVTQFQSFPYTSVPQYPHHFTSNPNLYQPEFIEPIPQRTPSPANSSSSSSSSIATDAFGAPSKLESRLRKIRDEDTKLTDGNKSSSMESLKSNGFNANAKAFVPKSTPVVTQNEPADESLKTTSYQHQVETETVYYDSHHSFMLSPYVDEEPKKVVEESDKLSHDQKVNLLYVTTTAPKYLHEALSYYMEYYQELGHNICKSAVDEILSDKGIEYKACDFTLLS